jgi:hypothetical protein
MMTMTGVPPHHAVSADAHNMNRASPEDAAMHITVRATLREHILERISD